MDPTIAWLLAMAFIIALGFTAYEAKAALQPSTCTECPHCREAARAKAREQQELREWYATRWNLPDRDEDDRRR